jgi:tetratricopeptide (TPR) repeat protein
LPHLRTTLNNLAGLQNVTNRHTEAEANYTEALVMYQKLAETNPDAYLPDLAMTLNNLALLQADTSRHAEAEANYTEALKIRRELAETNPGAYLPDLARTLNNLASLQADTNRYAEAEKSYTEAFNIFTDLVRNNNDFTYSNHFNRLFEKLKKLIYVKEKLSKTEEAEELKKIFGEIEKTNNKLNKV